MEKTANPTVTSEFKPFACVFRWDYSVLNVEREEAKNCCRVFPRDLSKMEMDREGLNVFNNSSYEQNQRLSMLKGQKPSDCQSCWNLEEQGFRSPRAPADLMLPFWLSQEETRKEIAPYMDSNGQLDWQKLSENVDERSPFLKARAPRMLEISLGNLCDMKCVYCTEHFSSSWAAEKITFGELSKIEYDQIKKKSHEQYESLFWEWFEKTVRHEIKYLTFLGGEPLINPKFYLYLETIIPMLKETENRQVTLSLVTNLNMSQAHLDKFIGMIPRLSEVFAKIDLNVSMESVSEKAEYIRSGVKWGRWSENFKKIAALKNPNLEISLQMAMNALNVTSIESYLRFAKSVFDENKIPFHARQNVVSFPEVLAPSILPASFASSIEKAVAYVRSIEKEMAEICNHEWGRWDLFGNFLERLGQSMQQNQADHRKMAEFYDYFSKLDQRRGTSFLQTFPEYESFWNECRSQSEMRQKSFKTFRDRLGASFPVLQRWKMDLEKLGILRGK